MRHTIEAKYRNGKFWPDKPVDFLIEEQCVHLTIDDPSGPAVPGHATSAYGGLLEMDDNEIERVALDPKSADPSVNSGVPGRKECREEQLDVLRQYETIMAHLRYDQTVFWTRVGFMIVSQIAMLGFFLNAFLATKDSTSTVTSLIYCLPFCVVGLILAFIFGRLRKITHWWIGHWVDLLKPIEHVAFDGIELWPANCPVRSARAQATIILRLFYGVWLAAIIAIVTRYLTS